MSSISIPPALAKGHDAGVQDGASLVGRKWVKTFVRLGGLSGEASVLDIGCGPGRMAIAVGDRFGWTNPYLGFEIRKADIDFCQAAITSEHPNFQFRHLNVRNNKYNPEGEIEPDSVRFPCDDASIDFCFATSVFTHMLAPEVSHYLTEAARVLKPGGTLLTTWFAIDAFAEEAIALSGSRFSFPHVAERGERFELAHSPEDVVGFPLPMIETMLASAGFIDPAFHQGGWMGSAQLRPTPPARHGQDIFVARKPL